LISSLPGFDPKIFQDATGTKFPKQFIEKGKNKKRVK
jgi:hypothetical protein